MQRLKDFCLLLTTPAVVMEAANGVLLKQFNLPVVKVWESQTMFFYSFEVSVKAVQCERHMSGMAEFDSFLDQQCRLQTLQTVQGEEIDSFLYSFSHLFQIQAIVTGCYLFILSVRCWKLSGGDPWG